MIHVLHFKYLTCLATTLKYNQVSKINGWTLICINILILKVKRNLNWLMISVHPNNDGSEKK